MADKYIRCPKDPKMMYLKDVCENIFRKEAYRTWCKSCQNFQRPLPSLEKPRCTP